MIPNQISVDDSSYVRRRLSAGIPLFLRHHFTPFLWFSLQYLVYIVKPIKHTWRESKNRRGSFNKMMICGSLFYLLLWLCILSRHLCMCRKVWRNKEQPLSMCLNNMSNIWFYKIYEHSSWSIIFSRLNFLGNNIRLIYVSVKRRFINRLWSNMWQMHSKTR